MPYMTRNGASPIIRKSTINVIGTLALISASFIMFQKIANVLSIISFVMVASMSGGAYFGYKYVTSEQFKSKVMNEILDNVSGMMPKMLDQGLPKITGPSMPISDTMSDDSKWFWDYIEKRNKEYIEWETKGKWENL